MHALGSSYHHNDHDVAKNAYKKYNALKECSYYAIVVWKVERVLAICFSVIESYPTLQTKIRVWQYIVGVISGFTWEWKQLLFRLRTAVKWIGTISKHLEMLGKPNLVCKLLSKAFSNFFLHSRFSGWQWMKLIWLDFLKELMSWVDNDWQWHSLTLLTESFVVEVLVELNRNWERVVNKILKFEKTLCFLYSDSEDLCCLLSVQENEISSKTWQGGDVFSSLTRTEIRIAFT